MEIDMTHNFPAGDDVWLVWSRGLKVPHAYLGHSAPGKPLFMTRTEKARALSKHLLKDEERGLTLAQLAALYPAPAQEEA